MKCRLKGCKNSIPYGTRSAYCCPEHAEIGRLNTGVKHYCKKKNKPVFYCVSGGCYRAYRLQNSKRMCPTCRLWHDGRKKTGPVSKELWKDFRSEICTPNGKTCEDFRECSDTLCTHKHGAFKYQTNGGVNCYKPPKEDRKNLLGTSFSVCSVNTSIGL